MNYKNAFRFFITVAAIACLASVAALTVNAQDQSKDKSVAASEKSSASRDPFLGLHACVYNSGGC